MSRSPVVAFVGPRASGKTTVARGLARELDADRIDTDERIAVAAGAPDAAGVLVALGEDGFRALEERVCLEAFGAAERAVGRSVVSLGGGAVLSDAVRARLRRPGIFVVHLTAPAARLAARIRAAPAGSRPALTDLPLEDEVAALLATRAPLYAEVADLVLDTGDLTESVCIERILGACR